MKGLLYGSISTVLLAIAAAGISSPASAVPLKVEGNPIVSLVSNPESAMTFNFTAPFITSSGALGSNYFIRIAVVGMSVKDLMISLPPNMENYSNLQVVDQSGRSIPAKITTNKSRIAVAFDQPVTPGNYLQVVFSNVQMRGQWGEVLFYGVTAERTGVQGEIPIGTARIQTPSRE
jgi:hypothetical protein